MSVKINKEISAEEKKALENSGIVFPEDGGDPYFQTKEAKIPEGMMKLPGSGRIIRRRTIAEVNKW